MVLVCILFILGFIFVVKGGDWFVDSSISIAKISGLPEILIGATIVSLATTTPEVIVSATAAFNNHTTMSVGNSVGSMICNMGLILGIVFIISPNRSSNRVFKINSCIIILYSFILIITMYDKTINRFESIFLLMLLIIYIILSIIISKKQKKIFNNDIDTLQEQTYFKIFLKFILGIILIILGSHFLIKNGSILANYIGIPEAIISLTLIALGTSLPELVTAISALKKKSTDISVGNIIGANILNIVMVLGVSGFIRPLKILKQNIYLDVPIAMILMLIVVLPSLKIKRSSRIQGILLLTVYILYIILLYITYIGFNS